MSENNEYGVKRYLGAAEFTMSAILDDGNDTVIHIRRSGTAMDNNGNNYGVSYTCNGDDGSVIEDSVHYHLISQEEFEETEENLNGWVFSNAN